MNFKKLLMIALFSFGLVNSVFANTENNKSENHQIGTAEKTFNQLTKKEQNKIIQFEKSFKPELRAKVREFLFDAGKMTNDNLALILNKQLGRHYLKVKDGEIEFNSYYIPSNKFKELGEKYNQLDHIFAEIIPIRDTLNFVNFSFTLLTMSNATREKYTDKQLQEIDLNRAMKFNEQGSFIEAADLFEILAEDGKNTFAQFMLGVYYLKGVVFKQDIGKAKKYWKLACDNGDKNVCKFYKELTQ